HGNAECLAHATGGPISGDDIGGAHRRELAGAAVAQRDAHPLLLFSELDEFGGEAEFDFGVGFPGAPQLGFAGILPDPADVAGAVGAGNITVWWFDATDLASRQRLDPDEAKGARRQGLGA